MMTSKSGDSRELRHCFQYSTPVYLAVLLGRERDEVLARARREALQAVHVPLLHAVAVHAGRVGAARGDLAMCGGALAVGW